MTVAKYARLVARIATAAMVAAGSLGPAAPAHAAGTYLALAYQPYYEFDGKTVWGQAHGIGQSPVSDTARINALNDCANDGGGMAVVSACPS